MARRGLNELRVVFQNDFFHSFQFLVKKEVYLKCLHLLGSKVKKIAYFKELPDHPINGAM